MRRSVLWMVWALAALLVGAGAAVGPAQAGQTGKPLDSGIVLTVDVGSTYRPGEMVEIHFFVTNNGSLVEPTWPDGFPHLHPPNLAEAGLIGLDTPAIYGHQGAYRTSVEAPDVPGLYAVHAAAVVDGVLVFGFGSFQVVTADEPAMPAESPAAQQAMMWALAAFGVSLVVLVLAVAILLRQRRAP